MNQLDTPRTAGHGGDCQLCLSRRQLFRGAAGALGLAAGIGSLSGPALAADEVHWGYEGATGPESSSHIYQLRFCVIRVQMLHQLI